MTALDTSWKGVALETSPSQGVALETLETSWRQERPSVGGGLISQAPTQSLRLRLDAPTASRRVALVSSRWRD